ncbi:hypothetical protein JYU34_010082 [Plutella xylostella]|uniref:Uncharacterized protein n=1 Tax=Plutella xylostella TaxID=51655 RepID=A0ABQ7QHQ4_PLUXY|nr:hypothetical protein JYU34_010082 [Plutella xylostella]
MNTAALAVILCIISSVACSPVLHQFDNEGQPWTEASNKVDQDLALSTTDDVAPMKDLTDILKNLLKMALSRTDLADEGDDDGLSMPRLVRRTLSMVFGPYADVARSVLLPMLSSAVSMIVESYM